MVCYTLLGFLSSHVLGAGVEPAAGSIVNTGTPLPRPARFPRPNAPAWESPAVATGSNVSLVL